MTLKTGEPLQNSKYVVQSVLDQSDFGITYSARHALLDQLVFLQTLNDAVQQRSDFPQLKQQFLTAARSLSQQSDTLRVLDCFEENALPYIVLQYIVLQATAGQPPRLSNWLTLPPEPRLSPEPLTPNLAPSELPESPKPVASKPEASKPEIPIASAKAEIPIAPELMREVVLPQINGASKNGTTGRSSQIIQPQKRIPISFLVTLLIGLGLGAGAGFALRFQPAGVTKTPSLFGQEQAFPAQGDWPITEAPKRLSAEPKIEEPFYRTHVPDYSPMPQPLYSPNPYSPNPYSPSPYSPNTDFSRSPSDLAPSPEAKSDRPLEASPSPNLSGNLSRPAPRKQAIDSGAIPPLNDFDSIPNIQPSAAPANPAPTNLAPLAPRTAPERSPKSLKPSIISQ